MDQGLKLIEVDKGIVVQRKGSITDDTPSLLPHFTSFSVYAKCPFCSSDVLTSLEYKSGGLSWLLCCVLLLTGFWFGCCLLPCILKDCKDVVHMCPECSRQIGRYNKL